jgi:hypothetical protein
MIASAFALTVLGAVYEYFQHRVGFTFVTAATVMLALFGIAAHATSATMPLDVVLDARGITYAGAEVPWRVVIGVDTQATQGTGAFVRVYKKDGVLRVGPLRGERAAEMARVIAGAAGLRPAAWPPAGQS